MYMYALGIYGKVYFEAVEESHKGSAYVCTCTYAFTCVWGLIWNNAERRHPRLTVWTVKRLAAVAA